MMETTTTSGYSARVKGFRRRHRNLRPGFVARRCPHTGLQGPVRPRPGRAAALARRLRAAQGRGRAASEEGPRRRRPLADPSPEGAPRRAEAARRRGPPARSGRRLGSRPRLVARPHGPNEPPADRADDADLARLVRDVERRRRLADADAAPEPALPPLLARLVREAPRGDHAGSRDAALAERHGQPQGLAERELRARADGALHARRRPRLHRARRARAGAGPHRIRERLEARRRPDQFPLRARSARRRRQAGFRDARALRLAGRVPALPEEPLPPILLREQALELFHPDPAIYEDARCPGAPLREEPPRDTADRRCNPPPPAALQRRADDEAARRLHRRAPPRSRARDRH